VSVVYSRRTCMSKINVFVGQHPQYGNEILDWIYAADRHTISIASYTRFYMNSDIMNDICANIHAFVKITPFSCCTCFSSGLKIFPIPIAFDNYGYLVADQKTQTSVLIDPSDPEVVQVTVT